MKWMAAVATAAVFALCGNAALAQEDSHVLASKTPYKNTLKGAIQRGAIVFNNYCVLCHGINADGTGRAAKLYNPQPSNLITSDKNAAYKELIIRRGGMALNRSPFMPPWDQELTNAQISDVILFLESILESKINTCKKTQDDD